MDGSSTQSHDQVADLFLDMKITQSQTKEMNESPPEKGPTCLEGKKKSEPTINFRGDMIFVSFQGGKVVASGHSE